MAALPPTTGSTTTASAGSSGKTHIFTDVVNNLNDSLGPGLLQHAGKFIEYLTPIFSAAFAAYVLMVVMDYYRNGLDEIAGDIWKKLLGWGIVIVLAFNASTYTDLAENIADFPDTLASAVMGKYTKGAVAPTAEEKAEKQNNQNSAIESQFQAVDDGVIKIQSLDDTGYNFSVEIASIVFMLLGYALIIIAYIFTLIAKISLYLTLMMGPLFIGAMLFPATRQYGMNWIGQCLNIAVTIALLSCVTSIFTDATNTVLTKVPKMDAMVQYHQDVKKRENNVNLAYNTCLKEHSEDIHKAQENSHGTNNDHGELVIDDDCRELSEAQYPEIAEPSEEAKKESDAAREKLWEMIGNIIILFILALPVIFSIPSMASALVGGNQLAGGNTIKGISGGLMRSIRSVLKTGKSGATGVSNRFKNRINGG